VKDKYSLGQFLKRFSNNVRGKEWGKISLEKGEILCQPANTIVIPSSFRSEEVKELQN